MRGSKMLVVGLVLVLVTAYADAQITTYDPACETTHVPMCDEPAPCVESREVRLVLDETSGELRCTCVEIYKPAGAPCNNFVVNGVCGETDHMCRRRSDAFMCDMQTRFPLAFPRSGTDRCSMSYDACANLENGWYTCNANKELTRMDIDGVTGKWLNGELPATLSVLTKLTALRVAHAALEGTVPTAILGFTQLRVLELDDNRLSGTIPQWLFRLPPLRDIRLERNAISGTIADDPTGANNIDTLDISYNRFSGTYPVCLFSLVTVMLNASNNLFSGALPLCTASGGTFTYRPSELDLSANRLEGVIPQAYMMRERTRLADNMFTGVDGLMSPTGVKLDLSNNRLTALPTGPVPTTLRSLLLSNNRLSGTLPPLRTSELRIGGNMLSGTLTLDVPTPRNDLWYMIHDTCIANLVVNGNIYPWQFENGGCNMSGTLILAASVPEGCTQTSQRVAPGCCAQFDASPTTCAAHAGSCQSCRDGTCKTLNEPCTCAVIGHCANVGEVCSQGVCLRPGGECLGAPGDTCPSTDSNPCYEESGFRVVLEAGLYVCRCVTTLRTAGAVCGTNRACTEAGECINPQVGFLCDIYRDGNPIGWPESPCGFSAPCQRPLAGVRCLDADGLLIGELDFDATRLVAFPSSMRSIKSSLQLLRLTNNYLLASLPNASKGLGTLGRLVITNNDQLVALPDDIGIIDSLTALIIESNDMLTALPDSLGQLSGLRTLHISYNERVMTLGSSFAGLTRLVELHIKGNQLVSALPAGIATLSELQRFMLVDSCILDLSMSRVSECLLVDTAVQNPDTWCDVVGTAPARCCAAVRENITECADYGLFCQWCATPAFSIGCKASTETCFVNGDVCSIISGNACPTEVVAYERNGVTYTCPIDPSSCGTGVYLDGLCHVRIAADPAGCIALVPGEFDAACVPEVGCAVGMLCMPSTNSCICAPGTVFVDGLCLAVGSHECTPPTGCCSDCHQPVVLLSAPGPNGPLRGECTCEMLPVRTACTYNGLPAGGFCSSAGTCRQCDTHTDCSALPGTVCAQTTHTCTSFVPGSIGDACSTDIPCMSSLTCVTGTPSRCACPVGKYAYNGSCLSANEACVPITSCSQCNTAQIRVVSNAYSCACAPIIPIGGVCSMTVSATGSRYQNGYCTAAGTCIQCRTTADCSDRFRCNTAAGGVCEPIVYGEFGAACSVTPSVPCADRFLCSAGFCRCPGSALYLAAKDACVAPDSSCDPDVCCSECNAPHIAPVSPGAVLGSCVCRPDETQLLVPNCSLAVGTAGSASSVGYCSAAGSCLQCLSDADCVQHYRCNATTNRCDSILYREFYESCSVSAPCAAEYVCSGGLCQCPGTKLFFDGVCVDRNAPCVPSACCAQCQLPAVAPTLFPSIGQCSCVPYTLQSCTIPGVTTTGICMNNGTCRECLSNAQCTASGRICDTETHLCRCAVPYAYIPGAGCILPGLPCSGCDASAIPESGLVDGCITRRACVVNYNGACVPDYQLPSSILSTRLLPVTDSAARPARCIAQRRDDACWSAGLNTSALAVAPADYRGTCIARLLSIKTTARKVNIEASTTCGVLADCDANPCTRERLLDNTLRCVHDTSAAPSRAAVERLCPLAQTPAPCGETEHCGFTDGSDVLFVGPREHGPLTTSCWWTAQVGGVSRTAGSDAKIAAVLEASEVVTTSRPVCTVTSAVGNTMVVAAHIPGIALPVSPALWDWNLAGSFNTAPVLTVNCTGRVAAVVLVGARACAADADCIGINLDASGGINLCTSGQCVFGAVGTAGLDALIVASRDSCDAACLSCYGSDVSTTPVAKAQRAAAALSLGAPECAECGACLLEHGQTRCSSVLTGNVTCNDANPCTRDVYDPVNGVCRNISAPVRDGVVSVELGCSSVRCVGGRPAGAPQALENGVPCPEFFVDEDAIPEFSVLQNSYRCRLGKCISAGLAAP